jgi:hypothetical protein
MAEQWKKTGPIVPAAKIWPGRVANGERLAPGLTGIAKRRGMDWLPVLAFSESELEFAGLRNEK